MKSAEVPDKNPREPKPGAMLLIEEASWRVIYCGCVLPISSRSKRRPSKAYVLLRTLCWATLHEETPWVTTDVLAEALWSVTEVKVDEGVGDPYKQLFKYRKDIRDAFAKLAGMHVRGFPSVPPTEDWHWILEGDGRQLRINHSPEKIDMAWRFVIPEVAVVGESTKLG